MRIAFISYWSCPLTKVGVLSAGGMSVYIMNLTRELVKSGHKIDIYTRVHKENDESVISRKDKIRIMHLKASNPEQYAIRLMKYINDNSLSYDIIHCHYYLSGPIGCNIQNKMNIPCVITFHTLGIMKKIHAQMYDKKRIRIEKSTVNCVRGVISSTSLEKSELIKYYNADSSKITVIPPGVNHKIFRKYPEISSRLKLRLPNDKKIILFIGRIDPIKRINLLIEALGKLTGNHPGFENKFMVLLIGGDIASRSFWQNPEVKKIKTLIVKKNLECCIKFIGSQPHHMLPYYYCASDVVVMPSIYESFGLVVLEAMSSGRAVIASKVGGMAFLIKDRVNGRHFESENINELSDIVWELLNDPKQRQKLGDEAYKTAGKLSWERQAKETLSLYRKLV